MVHGNIDADCKDIKMQPQLTILKNHRSRWCRVQFWAFLTVFRLNLFVLSMFFILYYQFFVFHIYKSAHTLCFACHRQQWFSHCSHHLIVHSRSRLMNLARPTECGIIASPHQTNITWCLCKLRSSFGKIKIGWNYEIAVNCASTDTDVRDGQFPSAKDNISLDGRDAHDEVDGGSLF